MVKPDEHHDDVGVQLGHRADVEPGPMHVAGAVAVASMRTAAGHDGAEHEDGGHDDDHETGEGGRGRPYGAGNRRVANPPPQEHGHRDGQPSTAASGARRPTD